MSLNERAERKATSGGAGLCIAVAIALVAIAMVALAVEPVAVAAPNDPEINSGHEQETATVASVVMVPAIVEGDREVAVETRVAPPNDRVHAGSATCVDSLAAGQTAYVLFTVPPPAIRQSANGDRLQIAAPLCTEISKAGSRSRRTVVLTRTGAADTDWPKPQPQYVVVGDLVSQEQLASPADAPTVERGCEHCPRMIAAPEGHFSMGGDADESESPIHGVSVLPFLLSQFPVTVAEWNRCVVAKACSAEPTHDAGAEDAPVNNLSWDDAQQFVAWLSQVSGKTYRLPTEAEWEFAARANATTVYWWGDQLSDDRANCRECGLPFAADAPAPVGSFVANGFGLFDMAGGVDQWVADCWHQDYRQAPSDGSAWDMTNCRERVLRGGSWKDDRGRLTVAGRNHDDPHARDARYGFRVARSQPPATISDAAAGAGPRIVPVPRASAPTAAPEAQAMVSHAPAPDTSIFGTKPRLIKQVGLPGNHRHTMGIAVGGLYGSDFAMVCEMAAALAAGPEPAPSETALQVIPTLGRGGFGTIRDVFTLPSTDMAIVAVALADRLRLAKDFREIAKRLVSIAPLWTEELHVLAPVSIGDIHDLAGRTVNLGAEGSTTAILGHEALAGLGIRVQEINVELDEALEALRSGRIAATLLISAKPVRFLAAHLPSTGFHLLSVPYEPALHRDFLRAALEHDDYPNQIDAGTAVATVGVASALMAYNWPSESERFRLLKSFVERLFVHLPGLRSDAHHPKWKEVDLTGSLPGWSRFRLADEQKDAPR